MQRKMAVRGLIGLIAGVALEHIIAIVTSIALNFGYYSPCLVSLPERVGGEVNAVILQTVLCALLCGVIGSCSVFLGLRRTPRRTRYLAFGIPVGICLVVVLLVLFL